MDLNYFVPRNIFIVLPGSGNIWSKVDLVFDLLLLTLLDDPIVQMTSNEKDVFELTELHAMFS